MKFKHIISSRQFDKVTLDNIFRLTDQIKKGQYNKKALDSKIMATLFYEPSTRTRFSFESAMLRLGGHVISTENASEFSSAIKGESLADTIRIVNFYADIIVLRHPKKGVANLASKYSSVSIINAGDGESEHPTQALLDLYTIFSKFKNPFINFVMIGDLKYGRTIHSLTYLLTLYKIKKIYFISPKSLAIPLDLRRHLKKNKVLFEETEDLAGSLKNADVIYQTRIQKERFKKISEYQKYFGKFIINKNNLKLLKKEAIIMHPLPRVNEITADVDSDKRAIYFEQAQNGLFIRMALLLWLFSP